MCVRGLKGSGKSVLVQELLEFVSTRKSFINGIIHLSLRGIANRSCLLALLRSTVFKQLDLKADQGL